MDICKIILAFLLHHDVAMSLVVGSFRLLFIKFIKLVVWYFKMLEQNYRQFACVYVQINGHKNSHDKCNKKYLFIKSHIS